MNFKGKPIKVMITGNAKEVGKSCGTIYDIELSERIKDKIIKNSETLKITKND